MSELKTVSVPQEQVHLKLFELRQLGNKVHEVLINPFNIFVLDIKYKDSDVLCLPSAK